MEAQFWRAAEGLKKELGNAANSLNEFGSGARGPPPSYASAPKQAHMGNSKLDQIVPIASVVALAQQHVPRNGLGSLEFLQGHDRFLLKQHFQLLESIAGMLGCCCIEFANKYDIFDANTGEALLYVGEESDCLCRACCAPHHRAMLHVYDVRGGGSAPIYSVDKPFRFNCCVWMGCCQQKQTTLREGYVLGSSAQKLPCGGFCKPVVSVRGNGGKSHEFRGPCCVVGGLIELCVDQEFGIHDRNGQKVGSVVHLKPDQLEEGMKQFIGNHDQYLMELPPGLPAAETANMISTLLLLDYLFFDRGPPIGFQNGSLVINCFNLYCCGCICPCSCGAN